MKQTETKSTILSYVFVFALLTIFGVSGAIQAQTLDAFNPGANANVIDILPRSDGKILVGGTFSTIAGQSKRNIARLNADGTFDATFTTETDITGSVQQFLVQPDGKILLTGGFATVNTVSRIRVARINPDGTLDTGFNVNLTAPVGVGRAALQPDGKLILPVNAGGIISVLRRNADGSADNSFSSPLFNGNISAAVLQPDGKVLIVGGFTTADGAAHKNIARLNSNGSIDNSFVNPNPDQIVFRLLLSPDGKMYVSGNFATIGGLPRSYFARLNSDGTTDTSFQDTAAGPASRTGSQTFLQPDGKVVVSGSFETIGGVARRRLARLNPNGTLDTTFRDMLVGSVATDSVQVLSRQFDGKILIGGFFTTVDGTARAQLARITSDDTANAGRAAFDFDGDGRADLSVFRSSNQNWYINRSSNNQLAGAQFGSATDKLAPADYDGDGKTDIAVWRESEGNFYILNSSNNSVRIENFGLTGDVLTVGDWDGDGKADLSTFRDGAQSYFFYRGSLNNPSGNITYLSWGTSGDKPQRGDFDGDGKFDAAVFRPSNATWYIRQSSDNSVRYENWGISTDKFVPADYDGDSKTDLAVFRDGVWYIKQSSNNQPRYEYFGITSDLLVPADYDGDGKADIAVFRNGQWYLNRSTSGLTIANFGLGGDVAVPSAYIQ